MTRSIFITGASGGIGAAVARRFLEAGWHVALFARRESALSSVADNHPCAHVFPGDVTDANAIESALTTFASEAKRLDLLFNNAGVFTPAAPIDEVPPEAWRQAIDVNLNGMFYAARCAFGLMRRQSPMGGRIINNGSISAHVPREGAAPYTTTKHAITGLTRQISLDGRPFNIACSQIDIGNARTPLLEELASKADVPPPMIEVETVANSVLHMAELPLEANVQFMTLIATTMPYIGRG